MYSDVLSIEIVMETGGVIPAPPSLRFGTVESSHIELQNRNGR